MKPGDYVSWYGTPALIKRLVRRDVNRRGYESTPIDHLPPPENVYEIEFILFGHRARQEVYASGLTPMPGLTNGSCKTATNA